MLYLLLLTLLFSSDVNARRGLQLEDPRLPQMFQNLTSDLFEVNECEEQALDMPFSEIEFSDEWIQSANIKLIGFSRSDPSKRSTVCHSERFFKRLSEVSESEALDDPDDLPRFRVLSFTKLMLTVPVAANTRMLKTLRSTMGLICPSFHS